MPELPEVEVIRRSLLPRVLNLRLGAVQVRQRRLRTRVDVGGLNRELPGRRVVDIRRKGKYLLLDLDSGWVLLVHLGMTGRLSVVPSRRRREVHDHVTLSLAGGRQLRFNDARRFGLMELIPPGGEMTHPRLRHLGLDPFDPAFDARWLRRAAHRRRRPVKSFLMDATFVTGVGNIYASESIHMAGVHPTRAAGSLSWVPTCSRRRRFARNSSDPTWFRVTPMDSAIAS